MKFCKKCGVLYSDLLEACPRCGTMPEPSAEQGPLAADPPKSTIRRQWIAILIGIPAFILALYLIGYLFKNCFLA